MKIRVRITPNARAPGVGGTWVGPDGARCLIVRVAAAPVDGAANAAVVSAVADALGVPRGAVSLTAGARSRLKTLQIDTAAAQGAAMAARLAALLAEAAP